MELSFLTTTGHHNPPKSISPLQPIKIKLQPQKKKNPRQQPKKITTTITSSTTKTASTTITPPPLKIDPSHHIHIVTATIEPPKKPKAKKPSTVGPPPLVDLHDVVTKRERERERERERRDKEQQKRKKKEERKIY